jgi:dihydropyrimidinase
MLTADDLDGLNMEGAKYVCSPPPRDTESQAACWEGIEQGVFSVFSSDHCPFRYDDPAGKLNPKARTSFRWVPNGIPGVAARLPILFSEGVVKGRISINRFVELTSTNHAKIYGLYPRKGTIMVGADADIAIWDPKIRQVLTHSMLKDGSDYTPYEGREITGWPVRTIVRGKTIVNEGKLIGKMGYGKYLDRDKNCFASLQTSDARS